MPNSILFHPDENCDPRIAVGLRRRGVDVTTAADAGLLRAQDEEHLEYAITEGRVIFTQDSDFLRLDAAGVSHPGIAYCQKESRSLREIIRRIVLIWEIYEPAEMMNRVEFL